MYDLSTNVVSKYYIIYPLAACGISISQNIVNLVLNLISSSADVDNLKVLYYYIIVNMHFKMLANCLLINIKMLDVSML